MGTKSWTVLYVWFQKEKYASHISRQICYNLVTGGKCFMHLMYILKTLAHQAACRDIIVLPQHCKLHSHLIHTLSIQFWRKRWLEKYQKMVMAVLL